MRQQIGQRIVKSIDTTAPHDDQWAKGRVKLAQGIVLTALPLAAGAQEIPRDEAYRRAQAAARRAIAAGVPKPGVYVMDTDVPNAFATGRRSSW